MALKAFAIKLMAQAEQSQPASKEKAAWCRMGMRVTASSSTSGRSLSLKLYEGAIRAKTQRKKKGRKDSVRSLGQGELPDANAEAEPEAPQKPSADSMFDGMSAKQSPSEVGSSASGKPGKSSIQPPRRVLRWYTRF